MTNSCDHFSQRDLLQTLGVAALPMLTQGCDAEGPAASFRAKPEGAGKGKGKGKPKPTTAHFVAVARALTSQVLIDDQQRCSLPGSLSGWTAVGRQVRITRPEYGPALFTVDEFRQADDPDTARMNLAARQRCGTSEPFPGEVSTAVTAVGLSDAQAQAQGEFVERIVDSKDNGLVVLAAHGGAIEPYTDMQAEQLTAALAGYGASSWICKGWRPGQSAFDAWHIRSTDIHPDSFPGLAKLAKRRYAYAVSFHGMGGNAGLLIGGGGPTDLKLEIADAIRAVIGSSIPITVAKPTDTFNGDNPLNVVNWLTSGGGGGIQLEQDYQIRAEFGQTIVNIIADVLAPLL